MTEQDIERVAARAAEETLRKFLLAIGVNVAEPSEALELQKDFAHVRESRLAVAAVKSKALMVAVGVVMTGIIGVLWMAVTGRAH